MLVDERATIVASMRLSFLFVGSVALAQAPIPVPEGSSRDAVVALSREVRPSPRQIAWQRTEFNAFVHFGINTFTGKEWGDGSESPVTFAPTDLDARQWVETFSNAGMRGLVLTCKHHDGFCLWPSKTTEHDVANSPFRGGKGDVVAEVAAACREAGLRFGIYLSPWDRNCESFGTQAYQEVFLEQLRELCTGYGPLFEIWFDGAHCPAGDAKVFDWQRVFRIVRKLQPDAAIAITGPDVRWVGNEAGKTRAEEWSVLPLRHPAPGPFETDPDSWRALWELREHNRDRDLGSRAHLEGAKALCWWPAETDLSIRPGWFWRKSGNARVKSLRTLLDAWYGAVGGNAVLLLNVPPDRRGRIAERDTAVLADLGAVLRATFATDLAASGRRKNYPKVGEVYFDQPVTVDLFDLGEDIGGSGQRVERFRIEVLQNGGWRTLARGSTIGMRRLVRTTPVAAEGFRYWIEQSRGRPRIDHFRLYRRPTLLQPPRITRSRDGLVTLTALAGEVRYTLDGSPVGPDSTRYEGAFALPDGGTVRAGVFASPGEGALRLSTAAETTAVFGLAKAGWRVVECSSEQAGGEGAERAIDGDPRTHWHSRWSPDSPGPPHRLRIDLGRPVDITALGYLPRSDGSNGTIADYEFNGSADGNEWHRLAAGTFANVENNPVTQIVRLPTPAHGVRFVELVARREVRDRPWASCAELSVFTK